MTRIKNKLTSLNRDAVADMEGRGYTRALSRFGSHRPWVSSDMGYLFYSVRLLQGSVGERVRYSIDRI